MDEVRLAQSSLFKNFIRMSPTDFELLLTLVGPIICKRNTYFREASGDSFASLMYTFKVSTPSISRIIKDVALAVVKVLQEYVQLPTSEEKWLEIAQQFQERWHFPHCLGALDGKHVVIQCPPNSGSSYYNYKGTFSIVLFALVDANYCFRYVNVGRPGRMSDGGVFLDSFLYTAIRDGVLNLPEQKNLPGTDILLPYVFVADDAFPLTKHIQKPYVTDLLKGSPKRVFNYRLSRARRIVENAFGLLRSVFRIFRTPTELKTDTIEEVVLACVCIHNFLRQSRQSRHLYCPPCTLDSDVDGNLVHGKWRKDIAGDTGITNLAKTGGNATREAKEIRDGFMKYFMSHEGSLSFTHNWSKKS
ncbi:uncharacterized protein LOC126891442 [Diabrotica virgifera virgifera]|uniref:DDE Tnp4 domain-containing protein n=1 Tax=Diabrotica virgifera virgifera TaxID=50390 RepID=A0ABM5L2A6_DIAVI|nr:uncharacterized protein LOC126891442 [Diabrotica virgifera virgifera]